MCVHSPLGTVVSRHNLRCADNLSPAATPSFSPTPNLDFIFRVLITFVRQSD